MENETRRCDAQLSKIEINLVYAQMIAVRKTINDIMNLPKKLDDDACINYDIALPYIEQEKILKEERDNQYKTMEEKNYI